jgi:hypothetical protein
MAVVLAMAGGTHAQSPTVLTVRLYNTSGVPIPELLAARRAAELILRDTGINVIFRHCRHQVSLERPVDPCDEPLNAREVVVRIVDAPAFSTTLPLEAFGVAYVVKETDRGWLATVFSDRTSTAAARAGIEPGALVGLVMAHEVGHLLLGIDYHGKSGVMRADWPDVLLTHMTDDWRFSKLEAARIRQAASIRF